MKKDAQTIPNEANAENNITRLIEKAAKKLAATAHHVYDNKGLMEYLNIGDKLLKKLRDEGLIGYSHLGDKYWYTQADVDKFLLRFHYNNFSSLSSLPASFMEGGMHG
jgi:hypothetical protein